MSSHRMLRVNENIKQVLSLILRKEIEDPRIRNNFVTITRVDTARDLKHAKVYFVCLKEDKVDEILKGFYAAKGNIFNALKKQLTIRYIPDMSFHYDKALLETNRILEEIHKLNIKPETSEDDI